MPQHSTPFPPTISATEPDFPSFYLELATIEALSGWNLGLSGNIVKAFEYFRDRIRNARFVDPANTNNIISDELTAIEKGSISAAAATSLKATNWLTVIQ